MCAESAIAGSHNFNLREELPLSVQNDLDRLADDLQKMQQHVNEVSPPLASAFHFLGAQILMLRRDLFLHATRGHDDE